MKIKAIGTRIIIKPDPIEKKSKGGIILNVDNRRESAATQKGTVVDIGPMAWKTTWLGFGTPDWQPWCKVGDRVWFARYVGKMIPVDENDPTNEEFYMILNDEDVQAIIEDE